MGLVISDVRFAPAPDRDRAAGLLGYLTFAVDGSLEIDGAALRLTRAGRPTVSYPAPVVGGRRQAVVFPIDRRAQLEVEAQVLAALGLREATP